MRVGSLLAISGVVAAIFFTACVDVPPPPENVAPGDYGAAAKYTSELIDRNMKKAKVTGLSIALVDDQKVVWAEGFGWADKEAKVPARPETVYMAGSVSKLLTATALMQLREKGLVDIDRPLGEYLPEFGIKTRFPGSRPFTLRDMLTHHSGLPGDWFKGEIVPKPAPPESIIPVLADTYVSEPPGTVYAYSNLAFSLLGMVVGRVSGRGYAQYMDSEIFGPLGMTHSSFVMRDDIASMFAKPYRKNRFEAEYPIRDIAAGGLYTNVLDLSRFMQAVFAGGTLGGNRVVKPESLAEMMRQQNEGVPLDMDLKIGLAWHLFDPADLGYAGKVAFHDGANIHYRASFVTLPDHKLGAVALSNSATSTALLDRACFEALKLMLQAKSGLKPPKPEKATAVAKKSQPQEDLKHYEGSYVTSLGLADVAAKDGYLEAKISGNTFRFIPRGGGDFSPEYRALGFIKVNPKELEGLTITFVKIGDLDVLALKRHGGTVPLGTRVRPVPISEAWSSRTGSYNFTNKGDDQLYLDNVNIVVEKGLLVLEFSVPMIAREKARFVLLPVNDGEAVTAGHGRYLGETIKAGVDGGVPTLYFSGLVFRKNEKTR